MPRGGKSEGRVLIMDDVAWSEVPRRRNPAEVEDLTPASWVTQDDWRHDLVPSGSEPHDDVDGPSSFAGAPSRPARGSVGRTSSAGRANRSRPVDRAGRAGSPRRSNVAGRAMLDHNPEPTGQAGGPRVVAEFDWTSADAHEIEDRIWGSGGEHTDSSVAELFPPAEPDTDDDDARWGPRPRLIADEPGGRRTIVITGRVADRYAAPRRGREDGVVDQQRWSGIGRADRMALWAVALGATLVLVALLSGH